MAFALVFASMKFLLGLHVMTSFNDELWYGSVRQINAFLAKLLLVIIFYYSNRNSRTTIFNLFILLISISCSYLPLLPKVFTNMAAAQHLFLNESYKEL